MNKQLYLYIGLFLLAQRMNELAMLGSLGWPLLFYQRGKTIAFSFLVISKFAVFIRLRSKHLLPLAATFTAIAAVTMALTLGNIPFFLTSFSFIQFFFTECLAELIFYKYLRQAPPA
jgi:hypothetical protein